MRDPTTVADALETLSSFAELDAQVDGLELMLLEPGAVEEDEVRAWTVRWLQEHDADQTLLLVRRLFKVVLSHLRQTASRSMSDAERRKALRGMVSVMATVGEAAQKLDHLTRLFYGAQEALVTGTEEYHQLQHLYRTAIGEPLEEGAIEPTPSQAAVRLPDAEEMSDLQRILKDLDYELYFLKQDDGHPFLTSALRESTELACDFGIDLESYTGDDPLVWVLSWKDQLLQLKAQAILEGLMEPMRAYYHLRRKQKHSSLETAISGALMALMLAAKPSNLLTEFARKPCYRYFRDLHDHLRQALNSREYKQLMTYPPDEAHQWERMMRSIVHGLCEQLYQTPWRVPAARVTVEQLIHHHELPLTESPTAPLAEQLRADYEALTGVLARHPNGPLFKMLDLVREEELPSFDNLSHGNLPGELFSIALDGIQSRLLRLPSPIHQAVLSKPLIDAEFMAYLCCGALRGGRKAHLLINLQSRLNWKEQPRAHFLEHLPEKSEVAHHLTVVTFPTESPFYQQSGEYVQDVRCGDFTCAFLSALSDPAGGYYFPDYVRQALIPAFCEGAMEAIHRLFFGGAAELDQAERQTFIDLFHLLLTLKLLDLYGPESFSFACKDGVDHSMAADAGLYLLLKLFRSQPVGDTELSKAREMLHVPALMERERTMQPFVYERLLRVVRTVEQGLHHLSENRLAEELAPLYHYPWWD